MKKAKPMMSNNKQNHQLANENNVVDLGRFKAKKAFTSERKSGVHDAFVLKNEGSESANDDQALSERIERLKSSISRINRLMDELRRKPENEQDQQK